MTTHRDKIDEALSRVAFTDSELARNLRTFGFPHISERMEALVEEVRDAGRRQCRICLAYYEAVLFDGCPDCTVERSINDDARQVRDDYARAVGAPR